MSALGDKNISGLDVAVDDAFSMSGIECVGDFDAERQQGLQFNRPSGNQMLESRALQIFHRDEGLALFFPDVVNGADVGMVQG